RVRHDHLAAAGLHRGAVVPVAVALELVAREAVVHAPVVAHLVGPVVHVVVVPIRMEDAGAPAGLTGASGDPERRDAAAGIAERDMAGVVVLGADGLAEDEPGPGQRAAPARGEVGSGGAG